MAPITKLNKEIIRKVSKKRDPYTFKQISEREVEWSKKKNHLSNFVKFLNKLKYSKKPLDYIYRLSKYKFFKELNKIYPKSTVFLSKAIRTYPNKILFFYAPGTVYFSYFLAKNKFKVTEKILKDLQSRGITIDKILENEKLTMSILSKNFLFKNIEKSKSFVKYLDEIEKEIKTKI